MEDIKLVSESNPDDPRHVRSTTYLSTYEQFILSLGVREVQCGKCFEFSHLANYHFKYWSHCPHCFAKPPTGWDE